MTCFVLANNVDSLYLQPKITKELFYQSHQYNQNIMEEEINNGIMPPSLPPEKPVTQATMQPDYTYEEKSQKFTQTLSFKTIVIVAMSLLLLIPTLFISSLGEERQRTADASRREIAGKWADQQLVTGPVIQIPLVDNGKDKDKEWSYIYILPKTYNAEADVKTQTLYRGIYEAVVYNSDVDIKGTFDIANLLPTPPQGKSLRLNEAKLVLGVTDLRGITAIPVAMLDGKQLALNDAGTIGKMSEVQSPIDLSAMVAADSVPFSLHLDLKGSETLSFMPVGESTSVHMKGDCVTPSFDGRFLPTQRTVTDTGFDATWNVISVNRSFSQVISSLDAMGEGEWQMDVNLKVPVDNLQKSERALKYALLVIVLTFIAALFSELKLKRPINVFQYLLIGLALVLFFSLLLSLSEHIGFGWAYLVAAVMTVALVTLYLIGVLQVKRQALMIGALLVLLYAYIYVLLSLETYALLAGSIGLFFILAAIMYYSLNLTPRR